jgi:hypothetical protein
MIPASGFFSITVRNLVQHSRLPCCVLYTVTAIIMANILIGLGVKQSLSKGLCYKVPGHEVSMDHEVTSRK